MWFFSVLGFALEEKLCGAKCHKYFRPEGVAPNDSSSTYFTTAPPPQVHECMHAKQLVAYLFCTRNAQKNLIPGMTTSKSCQVEL